MSIDRLEDNARALLRVACCYDSVALPVDVLAAVVDSDPDVAATEIAARRLVEASLATPVDDDAIVFHRLVALVARAHLDAVAAYLDATVDRTRDVLVAEFARHDSSSVAEPLQKVATLAGVLPWLEAHPLGTWRANHADRAGRYAEAITLGERTVADRERVLGVDHPDTLQSRNNLANSYRSTGRYDDAITLHERTLADRGRVLGADHPHTLTSRGNLASSYWSTGRYDDAITLHERTLADRERVLGADHPDTRAVRDALRQWRAEAG